MNFLLGLPAASSNGGTIIRERTLPAHQDTVSDIDCIIIIDVIHIRRWEVRSRRVTWEKAPWPFRNRRTNACFGCDTCVAAGGGGGGGERVLSMQMSGRSPTSTWQRSTARETKMKLNLRSNCTVQAASLIFTDHTDHNTTEPLICNR